MADKITIEGGCNCGAIRYTLSEPPLTVIACHCTNCRKQSGAANSVNLVMKSQAVNIDGELVTYNDPASDSRKPVLRQFCGRCGSPIQSLPESSPSVAAVKAGTLDDASAFPPVMQIWTCQKLDWVDLPDGQPSFDRNVPQA